ncbi:MAG: molybdopterin molybdotransferase MoeA [Thermofilaceae archaeon]
MLVPIAINEAVNKLASVLAEAVELESEEVDLLEAVGRILATDVYSPQDRPRANVSAVDGYAVRSIDTVGASPYNPIELIIKYYLKPGQDAQGFTVERGVAARVLTGAPIPEGADAVVMDEDVEVRDGKVVIYKQVSEGSNIVYRGEDLKQADLVGSKGQVVNPAMVGAFAAVGIKSVKVYRKVRVALIAIGDELVEPGSSTTLGKDFNSTVYIVYSQMIKDWIFQPTYYGILPDDPVLVEEAIVRGIEKGADLVITTGGTGVGEGDVVEHVMKKNTVVFRGVRIRPGRPTSCSVVSGKPVVHLSGFPVASWTGYELLIRPAVQRWLGIKGFERPAIRATLTRRLPNVAGYTSLVRVQLRELHGEFYAEPYMLRGSGVISSLLRTNGYVMIPEDLEGYEIGSKVTVYIHTYW